MTIETAKALAARHGGQIEREIMWLVERLEKEQGSRENAPQASPAPFSAPPAPTLDIPAIRRAAQDGLPVTSEQVLALCEVAEQNTAYLRRLQYEYARLGNEYADVHARMERAEAVVSLARAWADAVNRQDEAAIERCEGELIVAIAGCDL